MEVERNTMKNIFMQNQITLKIWFKHHLAERASVLFSRPLDCSKRPWIISWKFWMASKSPFKSWKQNKQTRSPTELRISSRETESSGNSYGREKETAVYLVSNPTHLQVLWAAWAWLGGCRGGARMGGLKANIHGDLELRHWNCLDFRPLMPNAVSRKRILCIFGSPSTKSHLVTFAHEIFSFVKSILFCLIMGFEEMA